MSEQMLRLQDGYEQEVGQVNGIRSQLAALARNINDAVESGGKIDARESMELLPSVFSIGLALQRMFQSAGDSAARDRLLHVLENGQLILPE